MDNHETMMQFPSPPESSPESSHSPISFSVMEGLDDYPTLDQGEDPETQGIDANTLMDVQNIIESVSPRALAWQGIHAILSPEHMIPRTMLIGELTPIFEYTVKPLESVIEACEEGYVFPSSHDARDFLVNLPRVLLTACGAQTSTELNSMILTTNPLAVDRDSDVRELSQTTMQNVLDITSAALGISTESADQYWNVMRPWVRTLLDESFMKPQVDMFHKVNAVLQGCDSHADQESGSLSSATSRPLTPSDGVDDGSNHDQLQEILDLIIAEDLGTFYNEMLENPLLSTETDGWQDYGPLDMAECAMFDALC